MTDSRFTMQQTEEQRFTVTRRTGEPPFLKAFREGRLPGVRSLKRVAKKMTPKAKAKKLSQPKPATPVDPEIAKLREQKAKNAREIKNLRESLATRSELEPLRKRNKELAKQIAELKAEEARRAEGGLQSKIRLGASSFAKTTPTPTPTKPTRNPKPKRKGFAAKIGKALAKNASTTSLGKTLGRRRM